MVDDVERFHAERADGPVALCVHDWGGLIGLRWACEHPEHVRALVISATGFFADGKWHGLAKAMRTEGEGEQIVDGTTRQAFGQMLAAVAPGICEQSCDEYFKAYADPARRRGQLELYRSGDFSELERYRGALAALDVPTLLLFGSEDPFVPVATAHRFAGEIPHARMEILEGVGHFMFDEVPERAATIVVDFLRERD
jgi:haloalkane dehalogenase